jgi:hypothetical protein
MNINNKVFITVFAECVVPQWQFTIEKAMQVSGGAPA